MKIYKEDYGYSIQFTLLENDRVTPVDLTGYEPHLEIPSLGVDEVLTVVDAANGICSWQLEEIFGEENRYEALIYLKKEGEHRTIVEFMIETK